MPKKQRNIWVCIFDLHFPLVDKPTVNAIFDYIKHNEDIIAGVILGGDVWDAQEVSHHTVGKPAFRPKGAVLKNREAFDKEFLKPLEALLPSDCVKVCIEGNHCYWLREASETSPELDGLLDHFKALKMAERGWKHVPLGHSYQVGRLSVIHGEFLGGAQPCRKALQIYGKSVLFGHLHAPQSCAQISPVDVKCKHMAYCSPIAGAVNPAYMKSRPSGWVTGFTLVEQHTNKKDFNVYPVITVNGSCSIGGNTYGKKNK